MESSNICFQTFISFLLLSHFFLGFIFICEIGSFVSRLMARVLKEKEEAKLRHPLPVLRVLQIGGGCTA